LFICLNGTFRLYKLLLIWLNPGSKGTYGNLLYPVLQQFTQGDSMFWVLSEKYHSYNIPIQSQNFFLNHFNSGFIASLYAICLIICQTFLQLRIFKKTPQVSTNLDLVLDNFKVFKLKYNLNDAKIVFNLFYGKK